MKSHKMVNHTPKCGLRFSVFGNVVAVAVAVQIREKKKPQLVPQMHKNRKPQTAK